MLSADPLTTDPDGIKEIKVLGTWLGGRQTYDA
jgi:predicted amidohydrolase YtcJ